MKHHSHDSAIFSVAKAIENASKKQIEASKRLKYSSRLDEMVDQTIHRYGLFSPRILKKRYEVVRNRDNKKKWLPEWEVYRIDRKRFDFVDRFETFGLAKEYIASL